MKKYLLILLCAVIAANGFAEKPKKSKIYYFLFESASQWKQEDSVVQVTYDIQYGDGTAGNGYDYSYPYMVVKVKNKTMNTIYVDLAKCFLVKGEESYTYYTPGETRTTTGGSTGVSVNMGSVANAVGVGGVVGGLASGVNVGGSKQSSTTNVEYAQRIIAIPPMSAKVLEKKPVISYFRDNRSIITVTDFNGVVWVGNFYTEKNPNLYLRMKDVENFGGRQLMRGECFEYTQENSPITMDSYISYSLTEDCNQTVTVRHSCYTFQIWGMSNEYNLMKDIEKYVPDYKRYKFMFVYTKRTWT